MKKLFRLIAILFLFIFVIFLTSCTEEDPKNKTVPKKWSDTGIVEYVDPETGVHYLIYSSGSVGGITVRYNADGTIMVDPIK